MHDVRHSCVQCVTVGSFLVNVRTPYPAPTALTVVLTQNELSLSDGLGVGRLHTLDSARPLALALPHPLRPMLRPPLDVEGRRLAVGRVGVARRVPRSTDSDRQAGTARRAREIISDTDFGKIPCGHGPWCISHVHAHGCDMQFQPLS